MPEQHRRRKTIWRRLLSAIGPGFVTGAADDDPSGIGTYVQTGTLFGYSQLWLAFFTTPFMVTIQEMCARIGMVKGRGLACVIRERFGRKTVVFAATLLLVANSVNIGADLGAMASTMQLLWNLPFAFWLILFTAVILLVEIFVLYRTYAKYLKWLTLSLLAYVVVAFTVKQDWGEIVVSTLIPNVTLSKEYLFNLVALLGTTISPYLFFWQASEEVEEEIVSNKLTDMNDGEPDVTKEDVRQMRWDTTAGMIFSNVMTFFIIVCAASTLGKAGLTNIGTASEAAEALRPLAGDFTYWLFALGILGTGLLAVPVLAGSASYAVAETLGWRSGLYRRLKDAHGFYGVITVATLFGLLVNFMAIPPFQLLYYTAILNGMLAAPLMVIILLIANDPEVMGPYRNRRWSNVFGWIITGIMGFCSLALLGQLIFG
ncbi:MAG: Nramp family divalent metal transporter [Patescibacteria group bacterium]|nr:Nramp family divalent metal transporter [Patescibacteria group bacterium]